MNERIKLMVIHVLMGIGLILIIFSVFVGSKENGSVVSKTEIEVSTENDLVEMDYRYKEYKKEGSKEDNAAKVKERMEKSSFLDGDYDGYEDITPRKMDKSELPTTYKDTYDKQDINKSKEIAKRFVEIFYNFNGKYPLDYVEDSKKYVTDELYSELKNNHERGTTSKMYRDFINVEIFEPLEAIDNNSEIVWIAQINGEVFNYEKTESELVTDVYSLLLRKSKGDWKVADVLINAPF